MFRNNRINGVVSRPLRFCFGRISHCLLAVIAITSLGLAVAPPAGASGLYRVVNTVNPVHAYNHPTPLSGFVAAINSGTPILITCQAYGVLVRGSNNIWDLVININGTNLSGWISDYYASTPGIATFSATLPRCGESIPPPPSGGPTGLNLIFALSRVASQVGQTYQPNGQPWACYCDRFVAYAYGQSHSGHPTATAHYDYLLQRGMIHVDRDPPGGALVFYNISAPWGHVVFSLGGGKVVTTPYNSHCVAQGVVYITTLGHFSNYRGWSWPDPDWGVT